MAQEKDILHYFHHNLELHAVENGRNDGRLCYGSFSSILHPQAHRFTVYVLM